MDSDEHSILNFQINIVEESFEEVRLLNLVRVEVFLVLDKSDDHQEQVDPKKGLNVLESVLEEGGGHIFSDEGFRRCLVSDLVPEKLELIPVALTLANQGNKRKIEARRKKFRIYLRENCSG